MARPQDWHRQRHDQKHRQELPQHAVWINEIAAFVSFEETSPLHEAATYGAITMT
jgi:hypothetical protein